MRFNTEGFTPSDEQNTPATPQRVAIPVNIKDFSQSLQDFQAKVEALQKEFQNLFQDRVKVVFDAVPALEKIEIIQYTPYFMDGDVCEFSISSVSFYDDVEKSHGYEEDFDCPSEQQVLKDALNKFIYQNDELMKTMYGDHAIISITREGTEVDEYEHD